MKEKVVIFFLSFCLILLTNNIFLYFNLSQLDQIKKVNRQINITVDNLESFSNSCKKIEGAEIEYRTNIEALFNDLKEDIKILFISNQAKDILNPIEESEDTDIEKDELIVEYSNKKIELLNTIYKDWKSFEQNSTLIYDEPTYIESKYQELVPTDSVGIDLETGEVIRNYVVERTQLKVNPLVNQLITYNEIQGKQLTENLLNLQKWNDDEENKRLTTIHILWIFNNIIILSLLPIGFYFIHINFLKPLKEVSNLSQKALKGDLSLKKSKLKQEEYISIIKCLNVFSNYIDNATKFVKDVSDSNLNSEVKFMDLDESGKKNELATALVEMRDKMIDVNKAEKERSWEVQGLAIFSDLLQKNADNFNHLTELTISKLVKYLDANQGGIFIVKENEDSQYLELISSFAFDRTKFVSKRLELGEGLAGQAWQEKGLIFIKDLPENHMVIKSGLGDAGPTSLIIAPLIDNDEVYGVIELASFNVFESHQIEFVNKVSSSIASALSASEMNRKTKELLSNSQELTERLISQEEDMRQNLEEMQVIQERQETELKESRLKYEQKIISLENEIKTFKKAETKLKQQLASINDGNSSQTLLEYEAQLEEHKKLISELENVIKVKDLKIKKLSNKQ